MSRNTLSRPVRLLQPQQYTIVPTVPQRAASGAERFQRALGGARRADVQAAEPRRHGIAQDGVHPRGNDDGRQPTLPPAPVAAEPTGTPAPPRHTAQTAVLAPWPAASPQQTSIDQPAGDMADAWPRAMANFVETLCARADAAFRSWSATLPLDAQALPGTELQLNLSPHWLRLRFNTQSAQSAALISRHRARLISLLEEAPALPQGIDVDIA